MHEKKRVTIHDVAKLAEVSISSVSRYLADPKSVQSLAAYNIKNAIRELNYEPNTFARNLKRGRSTTIGIVVPYLEFYFAKVCAAVSDYFYERKFVPFICESGSDDDKEKFFIQELLNQRAAGLIVAPGGEDTGFLRSVAERTGSMVILDREVDIGCDIVAENHRQNAYDLTRFVVENYACDDVHMLFGPESGIGNQHIVRGVDDALRDCGVESGRRHRYFDCRKMDNAFAAVDRILACLRPGKRPALIAYGAAFFEYMVMGLNRNDPGTLSKVDIAGFTMRTSMDKLGIDFPCIMHNPEAAGIAAAEMLYNRVVSAGKAPYEPSRHEVKTIRHLQKGRGRLG